MKKDDGLLKSLDKLLKAVLDNAGLKGLDLERFEAPFELQTLFESRASRTNYGLSM